jgi:hypothetical protein
MKRGNLKTKRIYTTEDGKKVTKHAVLVRLRGKGEWVQAKHGETPLIFDTEAEADKIIIDHVAEAKKSLAQKVSEGTVKLNYVKGKR